MHFNGGTREHFQRTFHAARNLPLTRQVSVQNGSERGSTVNVASIVLRRYSRNQDFLSTEDLTLFLEAEQGVSIVQVRVCLSHSHRSAIEP